ncbi:hypothetical protein L596_017245 [Steinernema carpocapsae]|uniref:Protein kinase domain-containing protein n=1 Tax=Steinernema carpocapsae TaxID=34508 RepID=A0A4U5N1F7_STECR|nr:hypothetical protein L596_017245 [Steinernema carpocapsae]
MSSVLLCSRRAAAPMFASSDAQKEEVVFNVKPWKVLLVPADAVKHSEKLEDCSEGSSVYDEEPKIALEKKEKQPEIDAEKLQQRLWEWDVGVDGLPSYGGMLFKRLANAAAFEPMEEKLSWWQRAAGFKQRQVEVPHVVLWDFAGGHSCLDVNVVAGDVVHVVAEEYQVVTHGDLFRRLPRRWALARVINGRPFQADAGVIPTSYLISKEFYDANLEFFTKPKWFLGIASLSYAHKYLLIDTTAVRPGTFVVFSPQWLNPEPSDHRPFVLVVICEKPAEIVDEMIKITQRHPLPASVDETLDGPSVVVDVNDPPVPENVKKSKQQTKTTQEDTIANADAELTASVDNGSDRKMEDDIRAFHASSPLYVQRFVIKRNKLGRFLIFGHQFETLFDLVYHLKTVESDLAHKLTDGPEADASDLFFQHVPPPIAFPENPKRDHNALPMKLEMWAAQHFDEVKEPAMLQGPISYATRAVFDPFKKTHVLAARIFGLTAIEMNEAVAHVMRYKRTTLKNLPADEDIKKLVKQYKKTEKDRQRVAHEDHDYNKRNKLEGEKKRDRTKMPDDSFVVRSRPAYEFKPSDLKYDDSDILGKGAFATVYKGQVSTSGGLKDAAIKRLRVIAPSKDIRHPWVSELEVLEMVSHPNCALFYGFGFDDLTSDVFLAFELMEGALDSYVEKHQSKISINERIDFLLQVARGVGHLHAFDPQIVHGDLAARNVLMKAHPLDQSRFILKITDFGLSKATPNDQHVLPDDPETIPFNWLAPETWYHRELTAKSDVWAYGITALEIFGVKVPFGITDRTIIMMMLKEGHVHSRPADMPEYVFDVVLRCWRKSPVDRPSLAEVEILLLPLYIEHEAAHMDWVQERCTPKDTEEA